MKAIRFITWGAAASTALLAGVVQAQTTIKEDGVWRGSVGAGLSINDGTTRSTSANLNAEMLRLTTQDKIRFYLTGLYGKSNGVESANLIRGGGRYDYNLTPRVFGFAGLDAERDKPGNLELRIAPSLGLGYHVIKNDTTTFDVFGGVGYAKDSYFTPKVVAGSLRSSYGYAELLIGEQSTHKLTDTVSLRQSYTFYPNLNNHGEYRSVFDGGLAVALSSKLSLTVSLVNRYNSDPGSGIKKSETLFVTGIAAKIE
jgi:putative salt-induced outer membrane protein YdiY